MKRILLLVLMLILLITPCIYAVDTAVYQDNEYHFRFSYPADWKVSARKNQQRNVITCIVQPPVSDLGYMFNVEISPLSDQSRKEPYSPESIQSLSKEIEDVASSFKVNLRINNTSIVTLKDKKAILLNTSILNPDLSVYNNHESYYLYGNSYRYIVGFSLAPKYEETHRKILEDCLSSFEILE